MNEPRPLSAHRDQVTAQPRPTPLGPTDLGAQAAQARDTSAIHRVYRSQWLIVHAAVATAGEDPDQLRQRVDTWFQTRYGGRVRPEDVTYATQQQGRRCHLLLRLPTMVAEWKTRELADRFVTEHELDDAVIVRRGSRAEDRLRAYGTTLLPP